MEDVWCECCGERYSGTYRPEVNENVCPKCLEADCEIDWRCSCCYICKRSD